MTQQPATAVEHVTRWLDGHALAPVEIDCSVAVMLKILDGKCKMNDNEKAVMTLLYDCIGDRPGQLLDDDLRELIATARRAPDDALRERIYERRVLAETMIARPTMKAFKASIRANGLFQVPAAAAT